MKGLIRLSIFGLLLYCNTLQLNAGSSIFVAPHGNDNNKGTVNKPLKTIDAALEKAEVFGPHDTVRIILRQGSYELSKPIEIGKNNRKNAIIIKSYDGENVSVSGGKKISLRDIKNVTDREVLSRLQPQVKNLIREVDLKKAGISIQGLHPSGFGRPNIAAWSELFIDGEPLRLARWPNDSTVLIGEVVEPGANYLHVTEDTPYPVFKYNDSRPSAWKGEFWIRGYFIHGFADDMIKMSHVDTVAKTIHAAQQAIYVFMSGNGAPWRNWHALNLLEELDVPGEYVLDDQEEKIYFYPPKPVIESAHVSVMDEPLLAIENCSDVLVENITFEHGRQIGVYLENTHRVVIKGCTVRNMGGVGISVGKGTMITEEEKKKIKYHAAEAGGKLVSRMVGDLVGKVYQDVLLYRQAGECNGIVDCRIYNVGAGGISLGGGDRATLTPAKNYVENCRIYNFNRIEKSYRPGIWMDGVGNRVSKCNIYNAPSMAILFHGNDHLIELCDITNVCSEVDDQGAVYYGRDPSERGNVIRYCYFHELSPQHRVSATYHDDGACGAEVYGNIYYKAGSLPVLIGGGSDIHYYHNIFIDSPVAIHLDNRFQNWAAGMGDPGEVIDRRLNAVKHTEPPYSTAYPLLVNYWNEDPAYPKRNLIEKNLFYKIGNVLNGRTEWGEFRGNWITNNEPGFVDAADPLKGFNPDAELFQHIRDFPALPYGEIGSTLPE